MEIMYIPKKLRTSIFLILMVIQATLSSPVNKIHTMKDCGLSSCELKIEEPKETPNETNTLFDQLVKALNKQALTKDNHLIYDSKSYYENEGEDKNYKKKLATQLTNHALAHAESIIENFSSYENSGESKNKLVELETKISHHELNNGKPIIKDLYSYKKLIGSDQQLKELESKFSKQEQYSAIPAVNKNNVNSAEIDENLLKLLPKFDNKNNVSDKKHVNSAIEDALSSASQNDLYNGKPLSNNIYKELESKVSKLGLAISNSETGNKKSSNYDDIEKFLRASLSKNAEQDSLNGNKHLIESESKLPKQEATQVKSFNENSYSYENSDESNRKLIESASKVSQRDLSNDKPLRKDLHSYEKIDESNRKYKELENEVSKLGLVIANSKIDNKGSNNYDEINKKLVELLSKFAQENPVHEQTNSAERNNLLIKLLSNLLKQNSVHGNKHSIESESKLPKQEATQVKSLNEHSYSYENSDESNRKLIESASKVFQRDLSNDKSLSKDLHSYEKIDESNRKYKELENEVSKLGLVIDNSKIDNKASNNYDEINKKLVELLSKFAQENPVHEQTNSAERNNLLIKLLSNLLKQNSVHGNKHLIESESKLPKQEATQVKSLNEDSYSYENSDESNRKLIESASKVSQRDLSNDKSLSKDLHSYEKIDESNRKYKELENKVSKLGLVIANSKIDNKESNNYDEINKKLVELLSKFAQENPVHGQANSAERNNLLIRLLSNLLKQNSLRGNKHLIDSESELSNKEVTQVKSIIDDSLSYENSDEFNRKLIELASKVSQRDLSNDKPLSKDLLSYEKIDESNRKYKELENKISKLGLVIANSKIDNKGSNNYDEINKKLVELLSNLLKQKSVHGNKHLIESESELPNKEVTQVKSIIDDSLSYENSDEFNRKLIELASKVSQRDLSNDKPLSKDLLSYEKIDESNRKYKELENKISKLGLVIANSKIDNKGSNNYDEINKKLVELLSNLLKQNSVHGHTKSAERNNLLIKLLSNLLKQNSVHGNNHLIESESKLPKQEATTVKSLNEHSYSYENSGESNRKIIESETKVSNDKPLIYDYLPYTRSGENNNNVVDVWTLIGGLLSNKNSVDTNNKLLQLATQISNNEFVSAVAIINDLIYHDNTDATKQKLIELKANLVQHIPANQNSKPSVEVTSTKNHINTNNYLNEVLAALLRQKLTDIKNKSNADLSSENTANSYNEKIIELLNALNLRPYGNDALSSDNPTEKNRGYKKEVLILHPYGIDVLFNDKPIE